MRAAAGVLSPSRSIRLSATRSQILGDGGERNRDVNVYLNDEDVRVLQGLETEVGESDVLVILPAMAGGGGSTSSIHSANFVRARS